MELSARLTSWLVWGIPLGRFGREVLLTILIRNPIEFRVAWLRYVASRFE